jgi:hypothetical protein
MNPRELTQMTENVAKTLDELKGNAHVKKMETHYPTNGVPAIDVWVRRECSALSFPKKDFPYIESGSLALPK